MMALVLLSGISDISDDRLNEFGNQLGAQKLASALISNERFSQRVFSRLVPAGRQSSVRVSDHDLYACRLAITSLDRLAVLCGIAIFRDVFVQQTGREAFAALLEHFDYNDIRLGSTNLGLDFSISQHQVDLARLPELVNSFGRRCVHVWSACLPAQLVEELTLAGVSFDSLSEPLDIGLSKADCARIVERIAVIVRENTETATS
jgi:hypothetical protein